MGGCLKRLVNCALLAVVLAGLALGVAYLYLLPRLDVLLADAVRREFMLPPSSEVVITRGTLLDTLEGDGPPDVSSPAKISGLRSKTSSQTPAAFVDLPRTLLSGWPSCWPSPRRPGLGHRRSFAGAPY
jgi:hypothetical protein